MLKIIKLVFNPIKGMERPFRLLNPIKHEN